jgi:predicted GIY-YIG superfamily endonuclease
MATPGERCNVAEITWHVYQLRNSTDLLYVGYTRNLKRRLADHRLGKPWWPEVTSIKAEEFSSEDAARQRELQIWEDEDPKYNKCCPFRVPAELKELKRLRDSGRARSNLEYERARSGSRWTAERQARDKTPKYRAWRSAYNREYRELGPRRSRQTGPGLF